MSNTLPKNKNNTKKKKTDRYVQRQLRHSCSVLTKYAELLNQITCNSNMNAAFPVYKSSKNSTTSTALHARLFIEYMDETCTTTNIACNCNHVTQSWRYSEGIDKYEISLNFIWLVAAKQAIEMYTLNQALTLLRLCEVHQPWFWPV